MDDEELELEADEEEVPPTPFDLEETVHAFKEADDRWKDDRSLKLGDDVWRPDLVREDDSALLHVHVAERLRGYALRRLASAIADDIEVHIAIPLERLYDEELLCELAAVDAFIHILGQPIEEKPARILAVLADQGIKVSPEVRTALGREGLRFARADGTSDQKGKRFEALVSFLLSQVEDFSVFERNYNTSTEEIDVIVQQRAVHGRVWTIGGVPFVLAEAKNREDGISQAMFSTFRVKLQTKRSTARIGLMFSGTTVSAKAVEQETKFASQDLTIAFFDSDTVEAWIGAADGTAFLERAISDAMLS